MTNAPESKQLDGEDSVDDETLLDMDACFTAFDKDGWVQRLKMAFLPTREFVVFHEEPRTIVAYDFARYLTSRPVPLFCNNSQVFLILWIVCNQQKLAVSI